MLKLNETNLVHYCISYLSLRGCFVWRSNSGRMKITDKYGKDRMFIAGFKGLADIVGMTKEGRFLAIEAKIKPNKPTPAQEMFLEDVRNHGGIALVIYSTGEIEKAFK